MAHLKPVSKADMSWTGGSSIDIPAIISAVFSGLTSFVTSVLQTKSTQPTS